MPVPGFKLSTRRHWIIHILTCSPIQIRSTCSGNCKKRNFVRQLHRFVVSVSRTNKPETIGRLDTTHDIDMNIIQDHTGLKHVGAFPQDTSENNTSFCRRHLGSGFFDTLKIEWCQARCSDYRGWHDQVDSVGSWCDRSGTSAHGYFTRSRLAERGYRYIWWRATINLTWRAPHPMITRLAPCLWTQIWDHQWDW